MGVKTHCQYQWSWDKHYSPGILGDPGADSGGEGKSKQAGKYGTKEKPDQFQTVAAVLASDWCFWLVPENLSFSGTNQKPERWRPFGTGLVRHCPQGLFWPFFTFLRALFFRPFKFSLAPTICPWVSEDALRAVTTYVLCCYLAPSMSALKMCIFSNIVLKWHYFCCGLGHPV